MRDKYLVSVVMPIYNMEMYLAEAIDSIIRQTVGFEESIQLIFVNDGSKDSSEEICLSYRNRFPDNIVYIYKENGGVSSARNEGIRHIKGKYTLFFDGDDIWEYNAIESMIMLFEKADSNCKIVCTPIQYFGDFEGREYPLNYKFSGGSRVVNLLDEADSIVITIGNCMFLSDVLFEREFDTNMEYCEDSFFINSILIDNPDLGLVSDTKYYYRKNMSIASASRAIPNRREWYTCVPKNYYLRLLDLSMKKYDECISFIQNVLMYDIQWRTFNESIYLLTSEETQEFYNDIKTILHNIEDKIICNSGSAWYTKLAMYFIKYGKERIASLKISGSYLTDTNGNRWYRYTNKQSLRILSIDVNKSDLIVEGYFYDMAFDKPSGFKIYDGNTPLDFESWNFYKKSKRDWFGNVIGNCVEFRIVTKVRDGLSLQFKYVIKDDVIELVPRYGPEMALIDINHSSLNFDKYIVKHLNKSIRVYRNSIKNRIGTHINYIKAKKNIKNKKLLKDATFMEEKQKIFRKAKLEDKVVFTTNRSEDGLLPNMEYLFNSVDADKSVFLYKNLTPSRIRDGLKSIYSSKVVVTDDYSWFLKNYGKKPGQKVIQIWHASGAFKKFGIGSRSGFEASEKLYHKCYDIVSVSSEGVRQIYADSFGIDVQNVKALGVPRTDMYFDSEKMGEIRQKIYEVHPEFIGKRIIVYAPTFRDGLSAMRNIFNPELNFTAVSESIPDDCIFIVCPHPVMENKIVEDTLDNVKVVRDVSTNEMMIIADLLITDYSSVIFEYSLLNKPMAFFCYDYDEYDRDFYLDYENELPGKLLKTEKELIDYLKLDEYVCDENTENFCKNYMSACDGHSSERIAKYVIEAMH